MVDDVTLATAPEIAPIAPGPSARFGTIVRRLAGRPLAMTGLVAILAVVAAAALAPLISPYSPSDQLFERPHHQRRAAAAEQAVPARHRPARTRPALAADLRRADLADRRHCRQWHRSGHRHIDRCDCRLLRRPHRRGADALHRFDDGIPGAGCSPSSLPRFSTPACGLSPWSSPW